VLYRTPESFTPWQGQVLRRLLLHLPGGREHPVDYGDQVRALVSCCVHGYAFGARDDALSFVHAGHVCSGVNGLFGDKVTKAIRSVY